MDGKMVAVSRTCPRSDWKVCRRWRRLGRCGAMAPDKSGSRDSGGSLPGPRSGQEHSVRDVADISDIVRGQVDPREKASQSKIKAQFATQRLDQRRRAVERTARDAARIQVELMCELYSPQTIRQQSGFDLMREIEGLEPDPNAPDQLDKEQLTEQLWEAGYASC